MSDDPMTLACAVSLLEDALAETSSIPELDSDGNRIGPDTEASWDGMDNDPPTVPVDLDAAWFLLDHVRADDTTPDDLRQVRARAYADGVLAGRAGITDTRLPGSNDDEEDDRG